MRRSYPCTDAVSAFYSLSPQPTGFSFIIRLYIRFCLVASFEFLFFFVFWGRVLLGFFFTQSYRLRIILLRTYFTRRWDPNMYYLSWSGRMWEDDNERVLHAHQSSRIGASTQDTVLWYAQETPFCGCLSPLQETYTVHTVYSKPYWLASSVAKIGKSYSTVIPLFIELHQYIDIVLIVHMFCAKILLC